MVVHIGLNVSAPLPLKRVVSPFSSLAKMRCAGRSSTAGAGGLWVVMAAPGVRQSVKQVPEQVKVQQEMSMISSAASWSCDPASPPESKHRKDDSTTCQIFEAGGALQTNKQTKREREEIQASDGGGLLTAGSLGVSIRGREEEETHNMLGGSFISPSLNKSGTSRRVCRKRKSLGRAV